MGNNLEQIISSRRKSLKLTQEKLGNLYGSADLIRGSLKSMQQLEAAGHSVDMNDLLLPTYLGHECLLDTDKYMRFSGSQVPGVLDAFESFTSGLIPDVEVPYEEE